MNNNGLPEYLEHGGQQSMPQPYAIDGIRMFSFILCADATTLGKYVSKFLTDPTQGELDYRPLLPYVMLSVYHVAKNHSAHPAPDVGWMSTNELCFFIPVARVNRGSSRVIQIAWWVPYIIVDNGWAMASGREVYGVPKEMGTICLPDAESPPDLFTASTLSLASLGPDQQAIVRELINIRRVSGTENWLECGWRDLKEAARSFWAMIEDLAKEASLPTWRLIEEFARLVRHDELPMVFLKQIRSVEDCTKACCQSILNAEAKITDFQSSGLVRGPFEIRIPTLASHPIVADLGLDAATGDNGESIIEPISAMFSEFSFTLAEGDVLWTSDHRKGPAVDFAHRGVPGGPHTTQKTKAEKRDSKKQS